MKRGDKNPAMKRRQKWTDCEDDLLMHIVEQGVRDWAEISRQMTLSGHQKNPKQICERWKNILNPSVNRNSMPCEQFKLIFRLQSEFKNKWSLIADRFPGRTDNAIKNKFFSLIRLALRKANRLVECFSSTRWVNSIKPKVLISFLEINIEAVSPSKFLPFKSNRLSGRDFIIFFIELGMNNSNYLSNSEDRATVLQFLDKLDQLNKAYTSQVTASKKKISKNLTKLLIPSDQPRKDPTIQDFDSPKSLKDPCFSPPKCSFNLSSQTSIGFFSPKQESSRSDPSSPQLIIPQLILRTSSDRTFPKFPLLTKDTLSENEICFSSFTGSKKDNLIFPAKVGPSVPTDEHKFKTPLSYSRFTVIA